MVKEIFKPEVSIVIPVFNGENLIQTAIDSVIAQSFTKWELIIIDDCSSDSTFSIISKAGDYDFRIRPFVRKSIQKGAPTCRNEGINLSTSNYVLFLDADDKLLENCLSQRMSEMNLNSNLDFGIFLQQVISDNPLINAKIFNKHLTRREDIIKCFLHFGIPWQTSACIWKKKYLIELNYFDPIFFRMEDPDLHIRALLQTDLYKCFYNYPPDCIYFIKTFSSQKNQQILDTVFFDVFAFLKKRIAEFRGMRKLGTEFEKFNKDVEIGFFHMLEYYLAQKLPDQKANYLKIYNLLIDCNIFSLRGKVKLWFFNFVYFRNFRFIKQFRLRGLVYRLIFRLHD